MVELNLETDPNIKELNTLIFLDKCKFMGIDPKTEDVYSLATNPKHLEILTKVCKFLVRNNFCPADYVTFVSKYYGNSKYKNYPQIKNFINPKVMRLFKTSEDNVEAIRYLFKPTTNLYNGIIFDPDSKKYYGFNENELIDAVESDYRYYEVKTKGVDLLLNKQKPIVTKDLIYFTEICLASSIKNRKVYANIIPSLFKYWRFAITAPLTQVKVVYRPIKKFQGEFEYDSTISKHSC